MKRHWIALAVSVSVAGGTHAALDNAAAEAMMKKDGCAACHEIDKKVIGPAFQDVAAKYKGDKDAAAMLRETAVPEVKGNRPIDNIRTPHELHDVDVGVVRALFGVAETGSVWLSEAQYRVNALGFLSQHLIVLLDPSAMVANMHRAYQNRAFFDAHYAVFMTGPSATADIEGVLIHGAQGIRTLTVIPVSA